MMQGEECEVEATGNLTCSLISPDDPGAFLDGRPQRLGRGFGRGREREGEENGNL
jgi:hypothetical protein